MQYHLLNKRPPTDIEANEPHEPQIGIVHDNDNPADLDDTYSDSDRADSPLEMQYGARRHPRIALNPTIPFEAAHLRRPETLAYTDAAGPRARPRAQPRAHPRPRRMFNIGIQAHQRTRRPIGFCTTLLIVALVLALSFVGTICTSSFLALKARARVEARRARLVYTPAREAERWVAMRFEADLLTTNEYRVREDEEETRWREVDRNWRALHDVEPFAVSGEELATMNESSIEIPSRPGEHLVKLAVFHQLHCLDMIRKYIHRTHYNFDSHNGTVPVIEHIDHCIDVLRQVLTCHADTALITFYFDPTNPKPAEPNFNVMHECKDFNALRTWEKEREVNMEDEVANNVRDYLPLLKNRMDRDKEAERGKQ
ncbi:hypothetical protein KEM56_001806 [Ascosphaera pollenicola]|nr:hypothetical protein KEM56_001806 [Ascosphaera pollenicola]